MQQITLLCLFLCMLTTNKNPNANKLSDQLGDAFPILPDSPLLPPSLSKFPSIQVSAARGENI